MMIYSICLTCTALYRGTSSQILRVAVGSGSQLTSFTYTKRFVNATMPDSHWFVATATSACVASVFVCVFMSPFDVAATRVYNQPIDKVNHIKFIYDMRNIINKQTMYKVKHKIQHGKGTLYNGPIDALVKIWKNEGLSAYLKVSSRKNRDIIIYY